MNSGNLKFLEPSGPLQASNGTAFYKHTQTYTSIQYSYYQVLVRETFTMLVDTHDLQRSTDQNVASTQNNQPNNHLRAAESLKKLINAHPNMKFTEHHRIQRFISAFTTTDHRTTSLFHFKKIHFSITLQLTLNSSK
jgi:hypothetical protein